MRGNQLHWWRDDPHFSQCYTIVIEGDTMTGNGEMSRDGGAWVPPSTMCG